VGRIINTDQGSYLLNEKNQRVIREERDILDLLARCAESKTNRLLIGEGSLSQDFFDLSSGLAGEITLKLSTYRVKTAIIVDLDKIPSRYFRDWAIECNRGQEIRFSASQEEAAAWLLKP
jgi:hypothetical protein